MEPKVGDYVECHGKDSYFEGWIISKFNKRSGATRYVVEDGRNLLLIKSKENFTNVYPTKNES